MFKRAAHPGEVLKGELEEFEVTPAEFARQISVPANRVSQIIAGKRSITGDTAAAVGALVRGGAAVLDELANAVRLGRG